MVFLLRLLLSEILHWRIFTLKIIGVRFSDWVPLSLLLQKNINALKNIRKRRNIIARHNFLSWVKFSSTDNSDFKYLFPYIYSTQGVKGHTTKDYYYLWAHYQSAHLNSSYSFLILFGFGCVSGFWKKDKEKKKKKNKKKPKSS